MAGPFYASSGIRRSACATLRQTSTSLNGARTPLSATSDLIVTQWSFLTNYGRALLCIVRDPEVRLRDIATNLDITERSAYAIVSDLRSDRDPVEFPHQLWPGPFMHRPGSGGPLARHCDKPRHH